MIDTPDINIRHSTAPANVAFLIPLFGGTLLLSAFLLFAIQPMFTKMTLPLLGGSPAVWNTAMVFFQAVLLAGYAYAHILVTRLSPRMQTIVHSGVLIIAFSALPIAVASGWELPQSSTPAFWLMALFAVSIGLPFFAVSANAPLIQAWYSRTGGPNAHDPYFLYAASNIGSIAALVLYPVLIETQLTLKNQSTAWGAAFMVLAALILICSLIAMRSRTSPAEEHHRDEAQSLESEVTNLDRLRWVALAFVPSSLLLGVTTHITTDVAAAPFLWVLPLILFLLTFVIAFSTRPLIRHSWMVAVQPTAIVVLLIFGFRLSKMWPVELGSHLIVFFVCAMVCHGELWRLRPRASALTQFYFAMSLGGVLGGAFNALAAPLLFNSVIEYPLVLCLALFLLPWNLKENTGKGSVVRFLVPAALIGCVIINNLLIGSIGAKISTQAGLALTGIAVYAMITLRKHPLPVALIGVAILAQVVTIGGNRQSLLQERGFFGVYKVNSFASDRIYQLSHGTTIHGAGYADPDQRTVPLSYYHRGSGFADAINAVQAQEEVASVGVVGLGAGALACYKRPGDDWTFFEIDPIVVTVARDTRFFSYLSDCAADSPIVIGDARQTLQKVADKTYDLLIIDAFSSDAVPAHLLTREAFAIYLNKTADDGMVLLHISNRNLDVASVVAAAAEDMGIPAMIRTKHIVVGGEKKLSGVEAPNTLETQNSHIAIIARDAKSLADLPAEHGWRSLDPTPGVAPWTDDFSNILSALLRKMFK